MATATTAKKKAEVVLLDAEGRGINLSLFERDAYQNEDGGAPGKAMYKAEVAYEAADIEPIEDQMADFVEKELGAKEAQAFIDGKEGWLSPFIDGDLLAKEREKKGKSGDAYKGKKILRVKTGFNKDGAEGPGGIRVYAPDLSPIGIMEGNQAEVYNGSYGKLAVTMKVYENYPQRGNKGITCYLNAYQKTRDGEPLRSAAAPPPFKALAGTGTGTGDTGGGVRRRRAG
jgi:hypothetical protein